MSNNARNTTSAVMIWSCAVVLGILHQDFWWWDDKTLVFGFMPIGLTYHALYSILTGLFWAGAVTWAWPSHIEQWATEFDQSEGSLATGESDSAPPKPTTTGGDA